MIFDPPGLCRIGGHYFHIWRVRPSGQQGYPLTLEQKQLATLHGAWWVTKFARIVTLCVHYNFLK